MNTDRDEIALETLKILLIKTYEGAYINDPIFLATQSYNMADAMIDAKQRTNEELKKPIF